MRWKSNGSYLEAHDNHIECDVSMTSDGIVLLVKPRDEQFYGCYSLYQFSDKAAEVFTAMAYGDVLAKQCKDDPTEYWKNPQDTVRCQVYDETMDDEWKHIKKLELHIWWATGNLANMIDEAYAPMTVEQKLAYDIKYKQTSDNKYALTDEYETLLSIRANRNMLITVQSVLNDTCAD